MSQRQRMSAAVMAIAATLAGTGFASSALAQEEAQAGGLDEVLVTATRRVTAQQTTPVSVTSIDASQLESLRMHDIGQMTGIVPNFSPAKITGFNAAGFAIRGTSLTDIIVYYEPPVAVIVDDFVFASAQTQLLETFDVESMEILRGPQGTLFGKNTTGGVVSVRTKRPQLEETSFEGRILGGSFDRREFRAAVNLPIGETLAFRISGTQQESDGYYENGKCYGPSFLTPPGEQICGDGADIGGDDITYARAKLLWQPQENFQALLQYEFLRDRSDTPPAINETPNDPRLVFNALGFPGITGGDPLDQAGVTLRDDGLRMQDGHRIDVDGFYLNLDWTLGNYDLVSVTGYREQISRLPNTYAGEVFPSLFDATRDDDRETLQQEIRIASNFDGPFNFVAGGFYQEEDTEFQVLQYVGIFNLFGLTFPPNFDSFTSLEQCLDAALLGQTCFDNTNAKLIANRQEQESYAIFLDGSFDVTEKLQVSAGVRWTHEEKSFFARPGAPLQWYLDAGGPGTSYYFDANDLGRFPCSPKLPCGNLVGDPQYPFDEEWEEPSWRATLGYKFTPDLYGFFTAARGFKSGGFNDQTGSAGRLPIAAYDPEFATSFEAGIKSEFLDNRVRLNATVFYVTYEDQQRSTVVPVPPADQETRTFNASEVTAQGVELEATALITDDFIVRGSVGYLDAEYDEFRLDLDGDGTVDQDLSGRVPTRSPEWTAGVDASYTLPIPIGSLRFNANVAYEAESTYYYSNIDPAFDTTLQEKTLLGASVTLSGEDDRWFVALFGRNLSDERYRTASQAVGALWTFATYGEPRTYGIEVGAKFGGN